MGTVAYSFLPFVHRGGGAYVDGRGRICPHVGVYVYIKIITHIYTHTDSKKPVIHRFGSEKEGPPSKRVSHPEIPSGPP